MKDQQAALIRAQQIRDEHEGRVAAETLAKQMIEEDPQLGVNALVQFLANHASVPVLPELEEETLFKMKQWVRIDGPDGFEYVDGDAISTAEVKTVARKVKRHAKQQIFRSDRVLADCEKLEAWEGFDPKLPHNTNVDNYTRALNSGDPDE